MRSTIKTKLAGARPCRQLSITTETQQTADKRVAVIAAEIGGDAATPGLLADRVYAVGEVRSLSASAGRNSSASSNWNDEFDCSRSFSILG